jgi:hypothetical protein
MSFTIEKEVVVYIVFNFGLIEGENHRFSTFEVNTKRLSEWEKWIPQPDAQLSVVGILMLMILLKGEK